jgi:hypothetical protein
VMNVSVNVPRILQAMNAKGWGVHTTAVNCGMNNKTVSRILDGKVPRRVDAMGRLANGLDVPIQEVFVAPTHKTTQGPRLYVVHNRRKPDEVA